MGKLDEKVSWSRLFYKQCHLEAAHRLEVEETGSSRETWRLT